MIRTGCEHEVIIQTPHDNCFFVRGTRTHEDVIVDNALFYAHIVFPKVRAYIGVMATANSTIELLNRDRTDHISNTEKRYATGRYKGIKICSKSPFDHDYSSVALSFFESLIGDVSDLDILCSMHQSRTGMGAMIRKIKDGKERRALETKVEKSLRKIHRDHKRVIFDISVKYDGKE